MRGSSSSPLALSTEVRTYETDTGIRVRTTRRETDNISFWKVKVTVGRLSWQTSTYNNPEKDIYAYAASAAEAFGDAIRHLTKIPPAV